MSDSTVTIVLPKDVAQIIDTIEKNGCQAYAVGGCVRDHILGRIPDDWDITTSALPMQVKQFFPRTIDTGIQHGTVTVMMDKTGYEVTTYRIDGEYKDGRHPENVEFSVRLVDDLKRRDFTINAMAYNATTGLVDEFDGVADLQQGIIRCVGNPKERFTEDALRMMRAIRFSAQLGFVIEPNTYAAIKALQKNIAKVSMERVQVELVKTLLSSHPDYVKQYYETGLFAQILPDLHDVFAGKYAEHIQMMLQVIEATPILRYAALMSTFSAEQARCVLKSLKLDNHTIETVSKLVAFAKETVEENEPAVRNAIHKYGKELMELMFAFDAALTETKERLTGIKLMAKRNHRAAIMRMYQEIVERGDCIEIKDLDISGNDLMEYGLQGKEIGKTLAGLLDMVMENPKLNDKATLIALIEHLD